MRGYQHFIEEAFGPNPKIPTDERIRAELIKIKKAFSAPKISQYDERKYISKLAIIALQGYEIDFGFEQILDLITSGKTTLLMTGWMGAIVIFGDTHDRFFPFIDELKRQITKPADDAALCAALSAAASVCGPSYADELSPIIAEVAISQTVSPYACKKALLALNRLCQTGKRLPVIDRVVPRLGNLLCSDPSISLCAATLTRSLLTLEPSGLENVFPTCLEILVNYFLKGACDSKFCISGVPSPFLVMQVCRILLYKSEWTEPELASMHDLTDYFLRAIDTSSEDPFLIAFSEFLSLAVAAPLSEESHTRIIQSLIPLLKSQSASVTVMAIDILTKLVQTVPHFSKALQTLISQLTEMVKSGKSRIDAVALSLVYSIATPESGTRIIKELIDFLPKSPIYLRESLCSKLAVLTQSYSGDDGVGTMISIMESGKDYCGDQIWRWAAQMLPGRGGIERFEDVLAASERPPEQVVKLCAFALGYYGGSEKSAKMLISKFYGSSNSSKSVIISSIAKIAAKNKEIRGLVCDFLTKEVGSPSVDVCQRCRECLALLKLPEEMIEKLLMSKPDGAFVPLGLKSNDGSLDGESEDMSQFAKSDSGILFKNFAVCIKVESNYSPPRATFTFLIENLTETPEKIEKFEITADDSIKFRMSEVSAGVYPKSIAKVTAEVVAMNVFDEPPLLEAVIGESSFKVKVPLLLCRWVEPVTITRDLFVSKWVDITDEGLMRTVQLVIPDGDVMTATAEALRNFLGIGPLQIDIPKNNIAACGVFRTFDTNVGVMLRISYDEKEMSLTMEIRATTQKAVSVIGNRARTAFRA